MQRFLWIPIISLYASSIIDRATTIAGLSRGYVETNPLQLWILAHVPWFFYLSGFVFPTLISLIVLAGMQILKGPNLHYHRSTLAIFFVALSMISWTPAINNLLLLRAIS